MGSNCYFCQFPLPTFSIPSCSLCFPDAQFLCLICFPISFHTVSSCLSMQFVLPNISLNQIQRPLIINPPCLSKQLITWFYYNTKHKTNLYTKKLIMQCPRTLYVLRNPGLFSFDSKVQNLKKKKGFLSIAINKVLLEYAPQMHGINNYYPACKIKKISGRSVKLGITWRSYHNHRNP